MTHDLVLVGGGHAHVQVLRAWAMDPHPGVRLTVVVDRPVAIYSGMVPGFVAGQYPRHALEIDVQPLARRAGARVVLARALRVDPVGRRVFVAGRPPIRYDVAAFNIGSTVAGLSGPGVSEHAIPTRPIAALIDRIDGLEPFLAQADPTLPVIVVGGGAAGVELAFTLRAQLARRDLPARPVVLLESGDALLRGFPAGLARRVAKAAAERDITLRTGVRVERVHPNAVALEGGEQLPCVATLWATGATSRGVLGGSGVQTDARGFALVRPTLQLLDHDTVFASGDCATLAAHPDLAKAGVYAVREGALLDLNLRALLAGRALQPYRPQRGFLTLLNLGDGTALGAKAGLSFGGRWAWRLKDRIDRRFMSRFQVLGPDGAPTPAATGAMAAMAGDEGEMVCGGCAAKVSQGVLQRALARLPAYDDTQVALGLAAADDAAVITEGDAPPRVVTVDQFRAFMDDPWLVGRVAAVNAVSDIYAMGAVPRHALALVTISEVADTTPEAREETLFQVLSGARATLDPLDVTLVGGHTTVGPELVVGFSVSGGFANADHAPLLAGGLVVGDRLVLTKPIGSGALLAADMRGLVRGPWMQALLAALTRTNASAAGVARAVGASSLTDITGFGLAGHALAMANRSLASITLNVDKVPLLPGALAVTERGVRSTFFPENARAKRAIAITAEAASHPALDLLFDPQTSGGMLFSVVPGQLTRALRELRLAGDVDAAVIGSVRPKEDAALTLVAHQSEAPEGLGRDGG